MTTSPTTFDVSMIQEYDFIKPSAKLWLALESDPLINLINECPLTKVSAQ
jgi:hypothetical protein